MGNTLQSSLPRPPRAEDAAAAAAEMAPVWTHPLLHAFATPAAAYAVDADVALSPASPLPLPTPQPAAPAIRPLRPSAAPSALACSIFLLARAFRPSLLINDPTAHG